MEYIFATLSYAKNSVVDLKIPAHMDVEEFIGIICQLYAVSGTVLQMEPAGVILNNKQTFAQQQAEHGALFTLHS